MAELNRGQVEVVDILTNSYSVDSAGRLIWVERNEKPAKGLVNTITARGRRAHTFGDFNAYIGDEDFRATVMSKGSVLQDRYHVLLKE